MSEAESEYERALQLEPEFSHGYRALVGNRRSPVPAARAMTLRAAIQRASSDEDRVPLNYAMFKELDDAGQVKEAWEHLAGGAALQRARQEHDGSAIAAGVDALVQAFDTSAPVQVDGPPVGHRRGHVFVVGMPRTGTTVLDRMLGNHPLIGSAGELNAFSRSLSWELDAYVEPPLRAGIASRAANAKLRAVGARYAGTTHALHPGKAILLDKNPLNLYNAGFIAKALPQARIICLTRDPMDACFSNLKELFAPGSYTYSYDQQELAEHYLQFTRLVSLWQRALPARFHVVRYEELVRNPGQTLQSALQFCGLDFDPAYADLMRNTSPVSTASRAQVRQPLNVRGIGAWRRYESQLQPLRRRLEQLGIQVGE